MLAILIILFTGIKSVDWTIEAISLSNQRWPFCPSKRTFIV